MDGEKKAGKIVIDLGVDMEAARIAMEEFAASVRWIGTGAKLAQLFRAAGATPDEAEAIVVEATALLLDGWETERVRDLMRDQLRG